MRVSFSIIDPEFGVSHDVAVDLPDGATVGQLASQLQRYSPRSGVIYLDGQPLTEESDELVSSLPPLAGAKLAAGVPRTTPIHPTGVRLAVVTGPDAGETFAVTPDWSAIGRSPSTFAVGDPTLSRSGSFRVRGNAAEIQIEPRQGASATWLEDRVLEGRSTLTGGLVVRCGQTEFRVACDVPLEAGLRRVGEELVLLRQPRSVAEPRSAAIEWPTARNATEVFGFPWGRLAVGLTMAAVMIGLAIATRNWFIAPFGIMSPMAILIPAISDRRRSIREATKSDADLEAAKDHATATASAAARDELAARRVRSPDLAAIVETALHRGARLWERRPRDDDFLEVSLGTATIPSTAVRFTGKSTPANPELKACPVTVSLAEHGAAGLFGPDASVRALTRALIAQLVVLHGPDDLSIVALLRDASHDDWAWLRWLPHTLRSNGSAAVGYDDDSTSARVNELGDMLAARQEAQRSAGARSGPLRPAVVVIIEDASGLRDHPVMSRVLAEGPPTGIYVIACEQRRASLPQECGAVVEVPPADRFDTGELHVAGQVVAEIRLSGMRAPLAEQLARSLAPIRVAGETADAPGGGVPSEVRLLDLIDWRDSTAESIVAKWRRRGRSAAALVGVSRAGPFTLDLQRHGPHGLVAGTSGAGKSQFLMTLVLALAIENTPEDLSFVLIDFKGGGAFGACAALPHTTAMVTNLEGTGAARAISALRAESVRRQALLADFGGDIDNYEQARQAGHRAAKQKIPRLVVIVDEFAQLAQEYPDLLEAFVNVARVGRSLGMHLILATQRPSGVVSPQIRSNAALRVALRVVDATDSTDVIESPQAAGISKELPGRAFVVPGEGLVEVQTAAVGLPRLGAAGDAAVRACTYPWTDAARGPVFPDGPGRQEGSSTDTDLSWAVELVRTAHELGGFEIPSPPVLPELPDLVVASTDSLEVAGYRKSLGPDAQKCWTEMTFARSRAVVGLEDLPTEQAQRVLDWTPDRGHLLLVGSPRSGRTTALRTIATTLSATTSPSDLHLYVFDFGGSLRPLQALPHVGAVVGTSEPDRLRRLVKRLSSEMSRRVAEFQRFGAGSLAEYKAGSGNHLAEILVLIDRWEVIAERDPEEAARLRRFIAEGAGLGITVVVTSDARKGQALKSEVRDTLVLPMSEHLDYTFFDLKARDVPRGLPPGRALRPQTSGYSEVQIAQLANSWLDVDQNAVVERVADRWSGHQFDLEEDQPIAVDILPVSVSLDSARALGKMRAHTFVLGVGGDRLAPLCWDPADHPLFAVLGSPGSGRTTVLLNLVSQAANRPLVIVARRNGALRAPANVLAEAIDHQANGAAAHLIDALAQHPNALVLIDDAELALDGEGIAHALESRGPTAAIALAASAEGVNGATIGLRRTIAQLRTGVLLHPRAFAHRGVLGLNSLDRADDISDPPGRGLWVSNGKATAIQAAAPR